MASCCCQVHDYCIKHHTCNSFEQGAVTTTSSAEWSLTEQLPLLIEYQVPPGEYVMIPVMLEHTVHVSNGRATSFVCPISQVSIRNGKVPVTCSPHHLLKDQHAKF
jgi:hypothetical protein